MQYSVIDVHIVVKTNNTDYYFNRRYILKFVMLNLNRISQYYDHKIDFILLKSISWFYAFRYDLITYIVH